MRAARATRFACGGIVAATCSARKLPRLQETQSIVFVLGRDGACFGVIARDSLRESYLDLAARLRLRALLRMHNAIPRFDADSLRCIVH
jgi:hypothetical protein